MRDDIYANASSEGGPFAGDKFRCLLPVMSFKAYLPGLCQGPGELLKLYSAPERQEAGFEHNEFQLIATDRHTLSQRVSGREPFPASVLSLRPLPPPAG